jgi:hypothetical protein
MLLYFQKHFLPTEVYIHMSAMIDQQFHYLNTVYFKKTHGPRTFAFIISSVKYLPFCL